MPLDQAIKEAIEKAKKNPDDIKDIIEALGVSIQIPKPPADNDNKDEMKKWFEDLKAVLVKKQDDNKENKDGKDDKAVGALAEKLTLLESSLGKLTERLESADKQIEEERKSQTDKKIGDYLGEMEKDGRLPPKDEEKKKLYKELLEKDFDSQKKVFDGMAKNPAVNNDNNDNPPSGETQTTVVTDKRSEHDKTLAKAREQIKTAIN